MSLSILLYVKMSTKSAASSPSSVFSGGNCVIDIIASLLGEGFSFHLMFFQTFNATLETVNPFDWV
jgi:hypothetical protein